MNPLQSDRDARVRDAFLSAGPDIEQIRGCRDSFNRSNASSSGLRLAHAIEMACVQALTRSLSDPSTASERMVEAVGDVWARKDQLPRVWRPARVREKMYLRHDWAVLQWRAERAYATEMDRAKHQFIAFAEARGATLSSMASEWKAAEQRFRKPVLDVYKRLLELSEEPLPEDPVSVAASLDERLRTDVVDALDRRRSVFLEQQGVQALIADITMSTSELPDTLWHRTHASAGPPFSREAFLFRAHLDAVFTFRLYVTLRQLSEDMNAHFESLLRRAHELRDMVEVNLGLASAAEGAEREALYRDGLRRAAQRAQELTETYRERLEGVLDKAEEALVREFRQILTCFDEQQFHALAADRQRLQRKDQALSLWMTLRSRSVRLWDWAATRGSHAMALVKNQADELRRWLGVPVADSEAPVARSRASDYLNETERRLAELPLIYKTLFSFEPVSEPRYLKGRDADLRAMASASARWASGQFTTLVLVGEEGSGKTSLLDRFLHTEMAGRDIRRVLIPQTITTEEELMDVLRVDLDSAKGSVVVLEGMQNLYLRHMNGFAAIDRFLLLMTETAKDVLWVCTCTRYAWNYLDDVIRVSASFTDEIHTDRMSAEDIRAAIMSRHRVSGYRAVFTPSESDKRSRAYKKRMHDEEARQDYLEQRYFNDLATWSRGNIKIAILFWLRTIRGITSDTFTIEPVGADLIEIGDAFDLDDLFAITAILQHQDVTVDELALNQNRSVTDCRMTLTRLHARRILIENRGRYSLNTVLLRPLTVRLQSRNILH